METKFVDSGFNFVENEVIKIHFVSQTLLKEQFLDYMSPLLVLNNKQDILNLPLKARIRFH